jgi:hypothetical protein
MTRLAGDIDIAAINPHIPRRVKLRLLEVVLAWARLDAAIAQFAAISFGLDLSVGAIIFGKMGVPDRVNRLRELNKQLGRTDNAASLKKLKADYETHSQVRNSIAHATLAGQLPDGRLVFLPYQSTGKAGVLPIDAVTLEDIAAAELWGKRLSISIDQLIDNHLQNAEDGFADHSAQ